MAVTINDVAKVAGVAKSTVSYVLSGKKHVSDKLINRVEKACLELDYKPNFFASHVITNRTGIIGLFFEQNNNEWYSHYNSIVSSLIIELNKYNMKLMTYFGITEQEITDVLVYEQSPIVGAIVLSPTILDRRIDALKERKRPFVLIGETQVDSGINNVDINNAAVSMKIFDYIYSRGHKNILFINDEKELVVSTKREDGLKKFIEFKGNDINCKVVNIKNSLECAKQVYIQETGANNVQYSCVVVASDIMASGIYEVAQERGIIIGKDLSVIAFLGDNSIVGLTRAQQNYNQIVPTAVKLLSSQVEKFYFDLENSDAIDVGSSSYISDYANNGVTRLINCDIIEGDSVSNLRI